MPPISITWYVFGYLSTLIEIGVLSADMPPISITWYVLDIYRCWYDSKFYFHEYVLDFYRCWYDSKFYFHEYLSTWYYSVYLVCLDVDITLFIWYVLTLILLCLSGMSWRWYYSVYLVFLDENRNLISLSVDIICLSDIYLFIWYFSTLIYTFLSGISTAILLCYFEISRW